MIGEVTLYTDFVAEMYEWVSSHRVGELQALPFYRERVSGEVSRPLSPEELVRHGTPVC